MGEALVVWRIGDVIDGRYEVTRVHEHGAMGVVYRVRHLEWGTDLAVKSPRPELFQSADDQRRFIAEAETWVSLGLHPHVCNCYYVRVLDGVPRVFAEYVAGGSLREWIDDRRLYRGDSSAVLARILDVAIQTAWGLDHAHGRGLVHQDVKPANVLVDDEDGKSDSVTAKITDFGLARVRAVTTTVPGPDVRPGVSVLMSSGGMTPGYASPEQATGEPVGRRSDIYSFAVSVLEMFTGGVSWMAGPVARYALAAYRADGPREAGLPAMPMNLADLLARCLAQEPADRPGSMADVAAELISVHRRLTGREYPRPAPVAADLRADELNNRALSLLDLGRQTEADTAFAQALAADPQHLQATYNSGLARWRRGAITDDDLVAHLERIRASTGDPWQARHLLAQVHLERGDLAPARELLDRVARDEPDEPEIDATLRAVQSGKIADARSVETTAMPWQSTASELWDIARSLGRSLVPANPIRIAADARLALTGSHDARVRLWDLRTGQCRLTLEGHSRLVLAVDVSPDGRVGVSASEDDTIRVWDLTAGRCLHVLNAVPPRKDKLLDCAVRLSADGRFVLWAGDGKVLLWDLHDTRRTMIHEGHFGAAIGLSVDGRLALFADGRHIRLWEPASRRGWGWQTLNLPESQSSSAVCVSADRRMAVTGARYDGTIRLWNLETGRCVRTLTGHTDRVQALSMSPDSRYLLSGGEDATVRLWDLDSGCCLRTFRGPENYVNVSEVGLDGGAREGISVSSDNTIRHWRMPGGYMAVPQLSRPRPHDELTRLRSLVEAQVGQAEQAIADGALPAALDLLTRVRSTPGYERAPRVLSAWRTLARSSVRVGLRAAWPVRVLTTGSIYSADLSQDGRIAATCGSDGTIRLWNVESGTCCRVIDADPHRVGSRPVESVCLSADGERILSGCGDGVVRLWSVETGECLRVLAGNDRNALSVRFSADDSQALVGVWGGVVQLWDLSAGSLLWTLEGHTKGLHGSSAGVSDVWAGPAGRLIASAGHDGLVRFAELESGRCMRTIDAHGGVVKSMCLSTDGRFALSSGGYGDRTIRLWDVATGKHVRCLDEHPRHEPNTVRLTTDDRFAVSAGGDATVRVWDVSTGACLCVLEGHRKSASGVAVSSDGRFVLSWGLGDGTARLWELDWELAAREPADWDDGATPYLEVFLARHGQRWTAGDVTGLLHHLEDAGYGWLRAGGVRARLDRMAAELAG